MRSTLSTPRGPGNSKNVEEQPEVSAVRSVSSIVRLNFTPQAAQLQAQLATFRWSRHCRARASAISGALDSPFDFPDSVAVPRLSMNHW
jgi:hypothetical protein